MEARAEADHRHPRRPGRLHAGRSVLEDQHLLRPDVERPRGMQVNVGMRLAPLDMLGGAVKPIPEMIGQAEPLQRSAQPPRGAGGGHGLRDRGKRGEERLDSGDGGDFVQPELERRLRARPEVGREGAPDLRLYDDAHVPPVEADIALDGLFQGGRMAKLGQSVGEYGVGQDLAVDDHSVEIEDQGLELQLRSPNRAVPTRTWVAPVATAIS